MKRRTSLLILLLIVLVTGAFAHDYIPGEPQKAPILLKGGTLCTVSGGTLENSDLLFENGRITQIAKSITPPAGAEVIDVTGQMVYPGLINSFTQLGLDRGWLRPWLQRYQRSRTQQCRPQGLDRL